MARPIFVQSLSSILTAILIGQFTLGASLALAQSAVNPYAPSDPFWSNKTTVGGQIDPNSSNFWFNASPNSMDPGQPNINDPWGNWADPSWSNLGASGQQDWGSMGNPYGGLGDMWGSNSYNSVKPTDPLYIQAMRWTGVISKNYPLMIQNLREKYSAYGSEDNDALADQIINTQSRLAAIASIAGAIMPNLLQTLQASTPGLGVGSNLGFGYTTGLGLGILGDFMGVIVAQANMMYEIQEVYGELSLDEDERATESTIPFLLGSGDATLSFFTSKNLLLTPPPLPPDPGPVPEPPVPPVTATQFETAALMSDKHIAKVAAEHGVQEQTVKNYVEASSRHRAAKTLSERLAARAAKFNARRKLINEMADQALIKSGAPEAIEKMAPKVAGALKDPKWSLKFLQKLPTMFKILIASTVSAGVSYGTCYLFGKWAKKYYKGLHITNLGKVAHDLRYYPRARKVIWLLLMKDIFPETEREIGAAGRAATKQYAALLTRELPLVMDSKDKNGNIARDELRSTINSYKKDPKIIDRYLANLRGVLHFPSKLEMIKILYAAALMKNFPTDHELETVNTVAVALGIVPPNGVVPAALAGHPEDPRMVHFNRYNDFILQLDRAANLREFKPAQATLTKNSKYIKAKKGYAGQLVIEDFEQAGVPDVAAFLNEVGNGGISPTDQAKGEALGQKIDQITGSLPPVTKTQADDIFNFPPVPPTDSSKTDATKSGTAKEDPKKPAVGKDAAAKKVDDKTKAAPIPPPPPPAPATVVKPK